MRLVFFTSLVVVMGLTAVTGATAAELTLDDCIGLALKNRASIISSRNAEELAAAGKRAALGAFLPNIDASYRYTRNEISNITPDDKVYSGYDTIITVTAFGDTTKVVTTK
jgi:outer membrane protein TolC